MDPWLENPDVFPDVNGTLITYLGDAINAALPEPYFARSAIRIWFEDQRREPDVSVFDPSSRPKPGGVNVAAVLADAGMIAVQESDTPEPFEEPYLEIRSSGDNRLVTAIEVLSLSNKAPGDKGRAAYLQKQTEYLRSGIGLVEIDLLRGGLHTTAVSLARLRAKAGLFAYHVSIAGAGLGRQRFAAPIKLADRLPPISIPLDESLSPVSVDLQPLLDRCYDNRWYGRQVRYDRPPDPPLTPEQQAWAEGVLREKGLLK
jgi:hypothetical protein